MTFPFFGRLYLFRFSFLPGNYRPFSPATLFLIHSALVDRLFGRPLLLNFIAPWPPFLTPGLGYTLRGQAAVSLGSCRPLRLYRLGFGLRHSGPVFFDGPLF